MGGSISKNHSLPSSRAFSQERGQRQRHGSLNSGQATLGPTPADPAVGNLSDSTLDQIQPRIGSGNTVEMAPRMAVEPGFDSRIHHDTP